MRIEVKKSKDGTKEFTNYHPEAGDKYVCNFDAVGTRENAQIVKGKAVVIKNHYLGVITTDGTEVTIVISGGQKKILDNEKPLKGKTIVFRKYKHKEFGELLGVRVEKPTVVTASSLK